MITNFNELYQYGVLGMKWGVRRYQPYPKGHKGGKEVGAAARASNKSNPVSRAIQANKEKKDAQERARKEAEERERERKEADKERVLRSGTAREVAQYRGELSPTEMKEAFYRLDWERKISDMSASEIKTNWQKFDSFMKQMGQVAGWLETSNKVIKQLEQLMEKLGKEKE